MRIHEMLTSTRPVFSVEFFPPKTEEARQTLFELSHDLGASLSLDQTLSVLGDRLKKFAAARRTYDPRDRMLNGYFRDLLAAGQTSAGG